MREEFVGKLKSANYSKVTKGDIDYRISQKSSAFQKIIEKYNCLDLYSVEDFKKELYAEFQITNEVGGKD